MMLGVTISVVFQLPHCVEQAEFPMPEQRHRAHGKPLGSPPGTVTRDFARRSKLITWPVGGLNHHLEHHLFPTICHIHYPAITKIVQEVCRDHGINCAEHASFWTGLAAHYRWLRQMGMPGTKA